MEKHGVPFFLSSRECIFLVKRLSLKLVMYLSIMKFKNDLIIL
jgi:hypothetical protein